MDVGGSIKRIKVEHSYAYSNESPGQYTDAGDPEEDPLLISPEDVKVEINHDFVLKTEEPDEYSYGVEENVTKFETSMVTDEPVETNFDNCYEQKTSEEVVCKTEVEETVECSKNFSNQVVSTASNPFALTNCFAQVIPNTIVIPNFSQLESHNESVKRSLEDLKNTNSRLSSKADKLTAANLKIKLELKALKKENAALKKEKYNALSKSETGQLDVKKLELELRCSKNRETLLEKKVSMLRTQVMRKPVRTKEEEMLKKEVSSLKDQLKDHKIEKKVLTRNVNILNKKFLTQESEKLQTDAKYAALMKQVETLNKTLASKEKLVLKTLQQTQYLRTSLSDNIKVQATLEERLQKTTEEFKSVNMNLGLKNSKLQKQLAEAKRQQENLKSSLATNEKLLVSSLEKERLLRDCEGKVKQLEVDLLVWKQKYSQMENVAVRRATICKMLKEKSVLLASELKKVEEQMKKKEEEFKTKTCEYCGF